MTNRYRLDIVIVVGSILLGIGIAYLHDWCLNRKRKKGGK